MRILIITAIAVMLAPAAAVAESGEPLSPAPVALWEGFYIGGQGGYGVAGDAKLDFVDGNFWAPGAPATAEIDLDGAFGGGHIGYAFQSGPWVVGPEASFNLSGIDGRIAGFFPQDTLAAELDWFANFSLKAGYTPTPRTLLFVRGGYSVGRAELDFRAPGSTTGALQTEILHGFHVGAGVEAFVWKNLTLGVEYSYQAFSLGKFDMAVPIGPPSSRVEADFDAHLIQGRLSYRF